MIVNQLNTGWEVIFQRAHELLAAQIAFHWQENQRPERWIELLAAISEHDNGQEGWHGSYHLNKAGAPMDFSMQEFSLKQAREITGVSRYKSRFVSLLISMHTSYLYEPLRGQKQETDQFLDDQLALQQNYRKSLGMGKTEAEAAYSLMHWADRCSLILCKQELPADERRLEVFRDPADQPCYIWQRNDGSLGVDPWPFNTTNFKVWAEYRQLQQLSFGSDQELAAALMAAKIQEREWVFRKN